MQGVLQSVTAVGSIATAFALIVGIWQLVLARRQATTDFEDELDRDYRNIIAALPVKTMLGEDLTDPEYTQSLAALYRYVDLTNKQVFLCQIHRVSKHTWQFWCEGIESNLARCPFNRAWAQIKANAQPSFSELRRLEASGFKDDPAKWRMERQRV
jgi:hypothetical protein